ncbi:MAG: threonine/serine exporter family protein [Anaerolineae bacterium]|nr:threonine/serine exporter family protein [Anaerolineae bacterium]
MNALDIIGMMLQDAFWSSVAATGFAILFNVPKRTLPGCALGGAVGHATRTLLMQIGMDIELATLVGATVIGFLGLFFARRWQAPALIFTISAAVTMVPGTFAYRAMIGLLELAQADPATANVALIEASANAIRTALILGAIAVGIVAPGMLFDRHKPVV